MVNVTDKEEEMKKIMAIEDTECKSDDAMNFISFSLIPELFKPNEEMEEPNNDNNIIEILSILSEAERKLVELHCIQQYNFMEIEKITGISHSTAHYQYTKAIKKLKQELEPETNWLYNSAAITYKKTSRAAFPYWDIAMRQRPCTLIDSLDGAACPGVYNDNKGLISLVCSKSYMTVDYSGELTIDQYMQLNNVSRKTAYKHKKQGKFKTPKVSKGRYKKTTTVNFKVCKQNVFDPKIHKYDMLKYYFTKLEHTLERLKGESNIDRYRKYKKSYEYYLEKLTDVINTKFGDYLPKVG